MKQRFHIPAGFAFLAALFWLLGAPASASAEQSNCANNCARALGLCLDSATTPAQVNLCADSYDCCMKGCGSPVPGHPCGDGA